jgi:hypothetical protein
MKQQPKFVHSHLGIARLGSGKSLVSFDTTVSGTLEVQRAGGKIGLAGPLYDYVPIFFSAESILQDAPHPAMYQRRVDCRHSRAFVSKTGTLEFVSDENELTDLRKRFESYAGPLTAVSR